MPTNFDKIKEMNIDEMAEIFNRKYCEECAYKEIDEKDKKSYHVYLKDKNEIKAYLRVLDKGVSYEEVSIGRVLTTERGIGLGNKILEAGIKVAKENMNADKIKIEAQSYAKKFYEKFGFTQISDEFLEDGTAF